MTAFSSTLTVAAVTHTGAEEPADTTRISSKEYPYLLTCLAHPNVIVILVTSVTASKRCVFQAE